MMGRLHPFPLTPSITASIRYRGLAVAALLVIAMMFATPVVSAGVSEPWRWDDVDRVVVVGDVHGACDSLVEILQQAEIIDEDQVWTGGDTHLVMLGDIVDRGAHSRAALDLLMRLETEAAAAGGQVHMVLGNHEVMNLVGELGYANAAEFAAFSKEEDPKARKAAFKRFTRSSFSGNGDLKKMRKVFAKRYPTGYFGQRDAFAPDGQYGRWLLQRPILVVVNDVVFVHGGLSPMLLDIEPDQINPIAMGELRQFVEAQHRLFELGVLSPEMSFKQQVSHLSQFLDRGRGSDRELETAARMFEAAEGMVFRRDGPLWYRGSVLNPEEEEKELVLQVLEHIDAQRVVVGHTPVHTDRVSTRIDGAVIMADTGMLTKHYGGKASAVEMVGGVLSAMYVGVGPTALKEQRWDLTSDMFGGPEDAAAFLESAPIVSIEEVGAGSTKPLDVILADNGRRCRAIFKYIGEGDRRYSHEVAAYRIDRLIGLDMVPPTVLREVEGVAGSLQLWVENAINEEDRLAEDMQPADAKAYDGLQDDADVFDVLIFNIDRNGTNMLITPADWRVHLIDHEQAFKPKMPSRFHLEDGRAKLGTRMAAKLVELDPEQLRVELDGLLTTEQIDSLLQRRDQILAAESED